ncbi:MAG: c-type cytochrome [Bacteroidetes bacterium]|nr:c-type cytochrome [Bacteroidota bacterium]MBP7477719.1 c-type cytochrome [Chitinophagales bacterium]
MDNKTIKFYATILGMILLAIFMLSGNIRKPGRIYAPDMAYSNAGETYGESKIPTKVGDSMRYMASRLPVAGTIPFGTIPQNELAKNEAYAFSYTYMKHFANTPADKARAGALLKNPYMQTPEVLKEGEAAYITYCSNCHGKTGLGDGSLIIRADGTDGPFKAIPPSYADRLKTLRDGEIFHSITYGWNMMGGHASQVSPDDRWKIICYIKKLGGLPDNHTVINAGAPAPAPVAAVETKK